MAREGVEAMTIDFNREKPIYAQLVDRICGEIIRNELRLGSRMPSVREYALEAGVNVNTIQRVYKELESLHLTETKRGQGTFITSNEETIIQLKKMMKDKIIEQFFHNVQEFGFSKEEIIREITTLESDSYD